MTGLRSIAEVHLTHKRVLIRVDFNVPIVQDRILNDRRIRAALPTIEYALNQQAAVILLSHLGRPTAHSSELSLEPVAACLSSHLGQAVRLVKDWVVEDIQIASGEVVPCENVRFHEGEQTNDVGFSQKIAQLGDVIVMDAFAVAHRTTASTVGIVRYAREACAGLLLLSELENLIPLSNPEPPFVVLMGGAKISTKLDELAFLVQRTDHLLLGGGLANAFLAAQSTKNSFNEPHVTEAIKRLLHLADVHHCTIHLPQDVVVSAVDRNYQTTSYIRMVQDVQPEESIGDIGPLTINDYTTILQSAGTIFWNGPMGIFEQLNFQNGTRLMADAISKSDAFSVAGGGETLTAIDQWQLYPTCVSTGGGALLAWLTEKPLPPLQALQAWEKDNLT